MSRFDLAQFQSSIASDADGGAIGVFEIGNGACVARITNYGATLLELRVPDRRGATANVVMNHATLAAYRSPSNRFFGATVGRFANRIADGQFTLDAARCVLEKNNGPNALHGGSGGFHARVWSIVHHDARSLRLQLVSPDGDQGYPGELCVALTYSVDATRNALVVDYCATTTRATHVNLTNHSYFNLTGRASDAQRILDHKLTLNADFYTPVDATMIPTGEVRCVNDALDFRAGQCCRTNDENENKQTRTRAIGF